MTTRGYIGNTDYEWYRFLLGRPDLDEVNFWQPSGRHAFRAVAPGAPFFFRLKSPRNAIAGFGYFARHTIVPAWLAWDSFGDANGARSFDEMCDRVERYRRGRTMEARGAYRVGCLMISSPVFFPPDAWVRDPVDWAPNIVQGKTYDLGEGEGKRIFAECLERARGLASASSRPMDAPRFGEPSLIRPRLGQGTFKLAVLDAYAGACALTGEHSLPVLDAAHIRPYGDGGEHQVPNGLLLRSDLHRLLDRGYLTVTPDYRVRVSPALREEFANGRTYYGLEGSVIGLPRRGEDQPDREALAWHSEEVFKAA